MKQIVLLLAVAMFGGAGCASTTDTVKTAIVSYLKTDGHEKAVEYIDQLVADGRLGSVRIPHFTISPRGGNKIQIDFSRFPV